MVKKICLSIILIVFISYSLRYVVSEWYFSRAFVASDMCQVTNFAVCARALELLQKAVKWTPHESFYRRYLGKTLTDSYRHTNDPRFLVIAEKHCLRALKTSWDRHYEYLCLGNVYSSRKDTVTAKKYYDKATAIIPYNKRLKEYLYGH